jgi:hypothetical protein
MEAVLLLLVMGAANIACFFLGAKVGQTVSKGETIEAPELNPIEIARKHQAKREAERDQNRIDVIMQNIDRYDGSGAGQKDVPGR